MTGQKREPAPTPAPAAPPVVAEAAAPSAAEALRRKRRAEGRTAATVTAMGGDNTGATKVLLGS